MNKNDILVLFGERVKQKRMEAHMTQDELAAKLGYAHKTSVSYIEKGKRNCTTDQVVKIANALGTTVDFLMDGYDDDYDLIIEKITNDCSKDRLMEYAITLMNAAREKDG